MTNQLALRRLDKGNSARIRSCYPRFLIADPSLHQPVNPPPRISPAVPLFLAPEYFNEPWQEHVPILGILHGS